MINLFISAMFAQVIKVKKGDENKTDFTFKLISRKKLTTSWLKLIG